MTTRSETIRMGLYVRIAEGGLSPEQQYRLFMDQMTLYRNALVHEVARWQADPQLRDLSDPDRDFQAFEFLCGAFAQRPTENWVERFWPIVVHRGLRRPRRSHGLHLNRSPET